MNFFSRTNALPVSVSAFLLTAGHLSSTPVPTPSAGDVFVGFRASDGDGSSVSYLVKIASDATFRSAAPGSSWDISNLGNIAADLTARYGANWHTRSDLYWGIFASRLSVNSSVYASRHRPNTNSTASGWPALGQTARNATAQTIVDVVLGLSGYGGSEATSNSPVATFQQNAAFDSSYNKQVGTAGTTDFGSLSQWSSIEASFGNGVDGAWLDLVRISSTGSAVLGTFSINAGGTIHFAAPPHYADTDTDGDGYKDAEELVAGTSATNLHSFPQAIISTTAGGIRIQSNAAAANQTYVVEYSASLEAGSWTAIATHPTGAEATPLDFIDGDPARRESGRGFYRIKFGL